MKIVNDVIFTDKDFELLKKELPNNPCKICYFSTNGGCCGCHDGTAYENIVKPYKENNILDVALKIKEYNDTLKLINKYEDKLSDIMREIPLEVINEVMPNW